MKLCHLGFTRCLRFLPGPLKTGVPLTVLVLEAPAPRVAIFSIPEFHQGFSLAINFTSRAIALGTGDALVSHLETVTLWTPNFFASSVCSSSIARRMRFSCLPVTTTA
jgi:hypothetical protein